MAATNSTSASSPLEKTSLASLDQKLVMAKRYAHEGVKAGARAAVVAGIAAAIPTVASARMLPWARAHLNHAAQALIISTAVAGAAYFIVADKTVLATARNNSFNQA
ncbi:hypothetical protein SAY87_025782 [Trapa incisa]|uniref:Early nodulin-93-like n=1 Tax=Trapa incisa TaxID=236973 RepID=A0AAN7GRZ2_9MYRT|nr:hypothetical protein SAY87_025782 [Trapa incisa]